MPYDAETVVDQGSGVLDLLVGAFNPRTLAAFFDLARVTGTTLDATQEFATNHRRGGDRAIRLRRSA